MRLKAAKRLKPQIRAVRFNFAKRLQRLQRVLVTSTLDVIGAQSGAPQ